MTPSDLAHELAARLPFLMVVGLLVAFALYGTSVPITSTEETALRIGAAVASLVVAWATVTLGSRARLAAGLVAICWFITNAVIVVTSTSRVSPFAVGVLVYIPVQIAFSWGLPPRRRLR